MNCHLIDHVCRVSGSGGHTKYIHSLRALVSLGGGTISSVNGNILCQLVRLSVEFLSWGSSIITAPEFSPVRSGLGFEIGPVAVCRLPERRISELPSTRCPSSPHHVEIAVTARQGFAPVGAKALRPPCFEHGDNNSPLRPVTHDHTCK